MWVIHFDGFKLFRYAFYIGAAICTFLAIMHDAAGWWL